MKHLTTKLLALGFFTAGVLAAEPTGEQAEFFTKKIQPILAENCFKCHSHEATKIKGGLLLDSREAALQGGDSGPAVVPGDPDKSLLIKAVSYTDPELQMPPKDKKLPDEQIALLREWIKVGAPWPPSAAKPQSEVRNPKSHWSFQPIRQAPVPKVKDRGWAKNEIDRFVFQKLAVAKLKPSPPADRAALIRRASYALVGLPPSPEDVAAFERDRGHEAFARVVDRLLASPHFGECWGRHWLDVARFAESSGGGRTMPFKDAWRYRDYVIESFNADAPYNRFVREQIAGDLLPHENIEQRRRQLIATSFLALGPTNYEEQDKQALRMDIIDEQLDTIGKAFFGLAIGCARCHDHKFDPIPQRDYYAMAGIFGSVRSLHNYTDNVANWVNVPLPLDPAREAEMQAHETQIAAVEARLKEAKALAAKANAKVASSSEMKGRPVEPSLFPGIVVDDTAAKHVGEWKHSVYSNSYIGSGALHDLNQGKGEKTLTFAPELPESGRYEVRFAFIAGTERSQNTPITIFHADGEVTVRVDQTQPPPIDGRFVSLGTFRFDKNGTGYVLVSNEGTQGHVSADAVQFLPTEMITPPAEERAAAKSSANDLAAAAKRLEQELKQLRERGPKRPLAMSIAEDEIADMRIAIRGNLRNLGQTAPRGFLSALPPASPPMPNNESGRRELADWIASPQNPLAARVIVNRVWHWLFGAGLVRTTDNFGATGELPSHPELLDHLAARFIEHGWSVKWLLREIMLSATWQQSSASRADGLAADVDNRLLWRMNRRRMEAEAMRDTILTVSGQLRREIGGTTLESSSDVNPNDTGTQNLEYGWRFTDTRRSVYTPAFRNNRLELFNAFDWADPNLVTGQRNVSTVAPQALYLLNHPFIIEQAKLAAAATAALSDRERIERAYRLALTRPPTDRERALALSFVSKAASAGERERAWTQFFQTIFACVDFRHIE